MSAVKDVYSWRVEWKCAGRHPNEFKPFCKFKEYPSEALASYEDCLNRPGCIEARIVERLTRTRQAERIIDAAELKGRI
jgi:hypothetical protein